MHKSCTTYAPCVCVLPHSYSGSAKAITWSLTLGERIELPPATKATYCLPLYS